MKQAKGAIQICSCHTNLQLRQEAKPQLHRHLEANVATSISVTHTSELAYWDAVMVSLVFW